MHNRIEPLLHASSVTGVAIAVIEKESVTIDCSGEFEGNALSNQIVWPVASLTKPLFVYGVLQLIQRGLLELDQPLQSYLAEPYIDDPEYLPHMTARHAMSHTTGFPNWRDSHGLRAAYRPGARFSYSSEGLNFLQYVVEHLLGTTLDDYLRQNVFVPFGMTQSALHPETEAMLPPYLTFLAKTLPANSAISLWTTIEDYARFVGAMFDSTISNTHSLNQHWLREMLTPQIGVGSYSALHWGLGWGLQKHAGEQSFWHWGARGIPRTLNFAVGWPEQHQAIVIFTNHADGLYLCRDIIHSLFPQKSLPAFDWLLPPQHWRADGLPPDQ